MDKKRLWIQIGGVALFGALVFGVNVSVISSMHKTKKVYVATREIGTSDKIQAGDFTYKTLPIEGIPVDAVDNPFAYVGQYPRTIILPDEPVRKAMFRNIANYQDLAGKYGNDMVAIPLSIDPTDFPLDQLKPGDQVNILIKRQKEANRERIVQNAPVLYVRKEERKVIVVVPKKDSLIIESSLDTGSPRIEIGAIRGDVHE